MWHKHDSDWFTYFKLSLEFYFVENNNSWSSIFNQLNTSVNTFIINFKSIVYWNLACHYNLSNIRKLYRKCCSQRIRYTDCGLNVKIYLYVISWDWKYGKFAYIMHKYDKITNILSLFSQAYWSVVDRVFDYGNYIR